MFVAWLANMLFGVTLFAAFWFTAMLVMWLLVEAPLWKGATYTVLYPLALWLVVAYFTVVRFLGYLDVRIRREGWEVELLLRAEQARLTRQWT